jgi:hypothetical protein
MDSRAHDPPQWSAAEERMHDGAHGRKYAESGPRVPICRTTAYECVCCTRNKVIKKWLWLPNHGLVEVVKPRMVLGYILNVCL